MLILTRKIGEEILIGDNIRIKILSSNFYQVHIGIEAPKEVPILRSELKGTFSKNKLEVPDGNK